MYWPLRVKSSRSKQAKSYHLSGWYWGIPDTRHSYFWGIRVAAFGQKQTLAVTNPRFIGQVIEIELFCSSFLGGRDFSP
jgi:hypothetical protein